MGSPASSHKWIDNGCPWYCNRSAPGAGHCRWTPDAIKNSWPKSLKPYKCPSPECSEAIPGKSTTIIHISYAPCFGCMWKKESMENCLIRKYERSEKVWMVRAPYRDDEVEE